MRAWPLWGCFLFRGSYKNSVIYGEGLSDVRVADQVLFGKIDGQRKTNCKINVFVCDIYFRIEKATKLVLLFRFHRYGSLGH